MVRCVPVKGYFAENCFFYIDEASRHGFVIDPGAEASRLLSLIRREGWGIEAILLTHGHFDHTGAVNELRETLGIPVYAHENSDRYLLDGEMNLSAFCIGERVIRNVRTLRDGDTVSLRDGSCRLQVIHTPGHTTDSVGSSDLPATPQTPWSITAKKTASLLWATRSSRAAQGTGNTPAAAARRWWRASQKRSLHCPMIPSFIPATPRKRPSAQRKEDIINYRGTCRFTYL